jgi:sensor histidine kinase YesM
LRSGEYTFFANAGDNSGVWNPQPHSTVIRIKKRITEKVWFYVVIFLGGFILITVIIKIILINQKKQNQLTQDLLEMQQRLLRTQMNPHFIFNSLLAIQNFIYKNEASKAGKYLSRFAKLIRLILNSSRKEFITLEEEIEFLNYYLELQKLRFKERFEYRFEIDRRIRAEQVYVPPMLAQPFIENAIEHGLKDISQEGMIIIRFFYEENDLVFEVEDNGVGIYQSEKNRDMTRLEHESLGQQITYDRLRLLSQTNKEVSYRVEELRDEKGNIKGTMIQFRINLH